MRNDIERILIDEAVIEKRLDSMALEIERDFPGGTLVVIILLKGALVFAADLLRRVPTAVGNRVPQCGELPWRPGEFGKSGFPRPAFPRSAEVITFCCWMTSSTPVGRLHAVSQRLIEEGAVAVHTAVLLAKDKERAEEVRADYVGFEIGDEFVVGYGLDYKGKYRNLPYVGVLKLSAAT